MPPLPQHLLKDRTRYLSGGLDRRLGPDNPQLPDFVLKRGTGAYVETTDSDWLLDVMLGGWSLILGHCPTIVSEAVTSQIELGVNLGHISQPVIDLTRLFVDSVPCAEKVRFVNSGSEAIHLAARITRAYTGKEKILKFEGAYHGNTDTLLFNTNYGPIDDWAKCPKSTPDAPGIPVSTSDLVLVSPYNDIDLTKQIVCNHQSELAGIFVEPVMRALSLERHERQFLQNLKELASEYLIPLVFDEACTGFRLAMGGAQEYYSVVPDLSVFTKALGGGYPIGAIAGSIELMNLLDRSISTGSYHANALSATAALATLNELEKPGTFERLNAYGNRLREGLFEVFKSNGIDAQMTGVGSIVEFFFTRDAVIDYPSARRSDLRLKQLLGQYLPRHGVLGSGGMYVSSACHGDTELSLMLDGVRASLQEIADAEGF